MDIRYLLFLILFLLVIKCEGFLNIYQDNRNKDSEYPDNKQFFPIHNNKKIGRGFVEGSSLGNNNYKIKYNTIKEPMKGSYSAFLDVNKIRTYDHFFHSPITDKKYPDDITYDKQFDYSIVMKGNYNDEVFQKEKQNDNLISNPFYLYGSAKMDPNDKFTEKILYSDEINDLFLKIKEKPTRYVNVH